MFICECLAWCTLKFKKRCEDLNIDYRVFEPLTINEIGFIPHYAQIMYDNILSKTTYEDEFGAIKKDEDGFYIKSQYGVADNFEQIKEYFKDEIADKENQYIVKVLYVYQDKNENDGNSYGTWRWHKWGPYIGKLNPQYEYLNDEEFGLDFQGYVICFHLIRVNHENKNCK